ncbi:MAG: histidinol-phosphatase [bacterium]|nr:histidinol-phosphatase [bacterium]
MGDYHVHLHPHGPERHLGPEPGEYPPGHIEAFVEAAFARGEDEVGFTEHLYRCVESTEVLGEFWLDSSNPLVQAHTAAFVADDRVLSLEKYVTAVEAAKDRGLPVLLGLEVDYFPETIDAVSEFLAPYPWDFLIGSTHWIGAWSVDHDGADFEFERRGVRTAYEDYFAIEAQLAASGAVDALAHCDVVKKHGRRLDGPLDHLYQPVVAAALASGTAVEVSSAGLHTGAGEPYPAPDFLRMFYEAGVPITTASDAHFPEHCARDFDTIKDYARAAGYTERIRFRSRRREMVPL